MDIHNLQEDSSIQGRLQEIEQKVKRVRAVLEEKGWQGLYIGKAEAFTWITAGGNSIMTRYTESGVIGILVTPNSRYAITNHIEYRRAIEEEKLGELGFEVLSAPWYEDKTLANILSVLPAGAKWGADLPLPGAEDSNQSIAHMQYSLLGSEMARYLHLGRVFSKAIEEVMAEIKPGDTELAVVGRINEATWKHNIDTVLYLVASDERVYNYRHCIATEKPIGKYLMVCCNGRYKGLITKLTRFVHFGPAPDELLAQYEDNVAIENRMIEATQIGEDNLAAFEVAKQGYEELGFPDMWKQHHQGGPQGYTNGYYLITPDMHETVVENQCYCYNPSITGTKTEDAFIVTKNGPVMVTQPVLFPALKTNINGQEILRPGVYISKNR